MLSSVKTEVRRWVTVQVKVPRQRSHYALKFEDRSQEGSERQERCARGDAWRLCIRNETGGKRIRCRLENINAHVEQERPELCRMGNRKGLKVRRRLLQPEAKCKQKKRQQCISENWIYS